MKNKKSTVLRIAALAAGEALLFAGILWGIHLETRAVNQTVSEVSDLKDPSPFRAALMGHLGKIHLGLDAYLRSPDPSLEKQVDESKKDFETLLPEFMQENPKMFPQAAGEEIKRTFGLFKDAIDHTMAVNAERMERRAVLGQNFSRILFLIDHNLRPLIRKEQADGEERSESVLNVENQMRAWQQNLAQAWAQPSETAKALTFENDGRGENYLELYSHMELLARERKGVRELQTLWQANSDLARESFVKESIVSQAQKAMDGEHDEVVAALNKYLPALPPAEMEAKKQSIMNAMRLHLAAAGGIGLIGLISLIGTVLAIYRQLHTPSAAVGGLYRAPATAKPTAASSAKEPTLQMDLKGLIIAWGKEEETLYGYTASEMVGQSIGKLFESESEIARLGKELQKATKATFDTTHKTKAGEPLHVRMEFQPIKDASGRAAIGLMWSRRS